MEIFGFEIKRKEEDNAQSFVAPINDDGGQVLEIGQGGYAVGGGLSSGQFVDMEGGVKSEQDLIIRYRQMSSFQKLTWQLMISSKKQFLTMI